MKNLLMILTLALILSAVPLMAQTGAANDQPGSETSKDDAATNAPPSGEGQTTETIPPEGEPQSN